MAVSAMELLQREPMPHRIAALPRDHRGYPVPRFVTWFDGKPDFRIVDMPFLLRALRRRFCFLCGQPLGRLAAFVVGPMCVVNRVSSEPPSHFDCARYAALVCPFLAIPQTHRGRAPLPAKTRLPPGLMLPHNPGVAAVYVTRDYAPFDAGGTGELIRVGEPYSVAWYASGEPAMHDAVVAAMRNGLRTLIEIARRDGGGALDDLRAAVRAAASCMPRGELPEDILALEPAT